MILSNRGKGWCHVWPVPSRGGGGREPSGSRCFQFGVPLARSSWQTMQWVLYTVLPNSTCDSLNHRPCTCWSPTLSQAINTKAGSRNKIGMYFIPRIPKNPITFYNARIVPIFALISLSLTLALMWHVTRSPIVLLTPNSVGKVVSVTRNPGLRGLRIFAVSATLIHTWSASL